MLHRIQQIVHERAIYAPIWQLAFINGQGKRVASPALGLIRGHRLFRTVRGRDDQAELNSAAGNRE